MTKTIIALTLSAISSLALADGVEFSNYVAIDQEMVANNNNAYLGTDISGLPFGLEANVEATWIAPDQSDDFGAGTVEIDLVKSFDAVDVYVETDLDDDYKRTETTAGLRYNF